MRSLIALAAIAALFVACNTNPAPAKTDATAPAPDSTVYPFKARYSSNFSMGTPANAKMVLDLYKEFDDNNLDQSKDVWADSVTMEFASGFMVHGSRDSVLAGAKMERGRYTMVMDSIDAWMPLHSNDKNEDWVAVWTREYSTTLKGKNDTTDLNELWHLKNGKVDYMLQYSGKHK